MKIRVTVLSLLLGASALGADGAGAKIGDTITLSQPEGRAWAIREKVCVSRNSMELACGIVAVATPTQATIIIDGIRLIDKAPKVSSSPPTVKPKGEKKREKKLTKIAPFVPPVAPPPPEDPAPRVEPPPVALAAEAAPRDRFFVGLGLGAGTTYLFSYARLEVPLRKQFSLSVLPVLTLTSQNTNYASAYGALLAVDYHLGNGPFAVEAGGGLYRVHALGTGIEEKASRPTVFAAGRFQHLLPFGLRACGLLGLQHVFSLPGARIIHYEGLLPLAGIELLFGF